MTESYNPADTHNFQNIDSQFKILESSSITLNVNSNGFSPPMYCCCADPSCEVSARLSLMETQIRMAAQMGQSLLAKNEQQAIESERMEATLRGEIESFEESRERLRSTILHLEADLADLKASHNNVRKENIQLTKKVDSLTQHVESADASFRSASDQILNANNEITKLRATNLRLSKVQLQHDILKKQMIDLKQELEAARRSEQAADARATKILRNLEQIQTAHDKLKKQLEENSKTSPLLTMPSRKGKMEDALSGKQDLDISSGVLKYIEDLLLSNDNLKAEIEQYQTLLGDARDEVLNLKEAIQSIGGEIDVDGNASFLSDVFFEASSPPWSAGNMFSETDREWTPATSEAPSSPTLANPPSPPKINALHQHHHYHYHVDKDGKSGTVRASKRIKGPRKLRIRAATRSKLEEKAIQTSPSNCCFEVPILPSTPTRTNGFSVTESTPTMYQEPVDISLRKRPSNASLLSSKIAAQRGVGRFNASSPTSFTGEQENVLQGIVHSSSQSSSALSSSIRSVSSNVGKVEQDPIGILHSHATILYQRLKTSDTNSINRRLRKPFVFNDLSQLSNKLLQNILMDIGSLSARFEWVQQSIDNKEFKIPASKFLQLLELLQNILIDLVNARININELQGAIVGKVEEKTETFSKSFDDRRLSEEVRNSTSSSSTILKKPGIATTIAINKTKAAADAVAGSLTGSVRWVGSVKDRLTTESNTFKGSSNEHNAHVGSISESSRISADLMKENQANHNDIDDNPHDTILDEPSITQSGSLNSQETITSIPTADAEGTWYFTAKVPPMHQRVANLKPVKNRNKESRRKSLFSVFSVLLDAGEEEDNKESPENEHSEPKLNSKSLAITPAQPTLEISNTTASPYIGLGDSISEAMKLESTSGKKTLSSKSYANATLSKWYTTREMPTQDVPKIDDDQTILIGQKKSPLTQSHQKDNSTPSAKLLSPIASAGAANAISISRVAHTKDNIVHSQTRRPVVVSSISKAKGKKVVSTEASTSTITNASSMLNQCTLPKNGIFASRSSKFVIDELKKYSHDPKANGSNDITKVNAGGINANAEPSKISFWSFLNASTPRQASIIHTSATENSPTQKQNSTQSTAKLRSTPKPIKRSPPRKPTYLESISVSHRRGSGVIGNLLSESLPGPGGKI